MSSNDQLQQPWRRSQRFDIAPQSFVEICKLMMIVYSAELQPPKVGEVWEINGHPFLIKRAVGRQEFTDSDIVGAVALGGSAAGGYLFLVEHRLTGALWNQTIWL